VKDSKTKSDIFAIVKILNLNQVIMLDIIFDINLLYMAFYCWIYSFHQAGGLMVAEVGLEFKRCCGY
jgi:hypothetical protein